MVNTTLAILVTIVNLVTSDGILGLYFVLGKPVPSQTGTNPVKLRLHVKIALFTGILVTSNLTSRAILKIQIWLNSRKTTQSIEMNKV